MYKVDKPFDKLKSRACCLEDGPTTDNTEVFVGPAPSTLFDPAGDYPRDENYPLVARVSNTCSRGLFFVADDYVAAETKDGQIKLSNGNTKFLPWYEEALNRYFLPDGWKLRNWVFYGPNGVSFPAVPKMKFDPNSGQVMAIGQGDSAVTGTKAISKLLSEAEKRADKARSRINYYVDHALTLAEDQYNQGASIPQSVQETEDMMFDLFVPSSLIQSATDTVYGSTRDVTQVQKKQALMAWLAVKLQVPVPVINSSFEFPNGG